MFETEYVCITSLALSDLDSIHDLFHPLIPTSCFGWKEGKKEKRKKKKKASSQDFETIFIFRKSSPRFKQTVQVKGAVSRYWLCGLKKRKGKRKKEKEERKKKEIMIQQERKKEWILFNSFSDPTSIPFLQSLSFFFFFFYIHERRSLWRPTLSSRPIEKKKKKLFDHHRFNASFIQLPRELAINHQNPSFTQNDRFTPW